LLSSFAPKNIDFEDESIRRFEISADLATSTQCKYTKAVLTRKVA
jgi:hypothetical protein